MISESEIVSEVTFGETSAGAATVQGAFVGEHQRHAKTMGPGFRRAAGGIDSREQTELNGKDEIRRLTGSLHLPSNIEEQAFGIYKLAATNNFIQGRRTRTVAAVCVYVACRRVAGNTTLLMDLAEKIQINVYKLGEVYKDLVKDLWLDDPTQSNINLVEVEPLILKFARKLEFGEQTMQVATDAARIIKRMKRDWMVEGRQPAGLCGACIILAARMNNFRRTIREVVYVVKVADATVFARLIEFKRTQSGNLTIEQFRKYGEKLKGSAVPPAIYKRIEREERRKRMLSEVDDEELAMVPADGMQAGASRDPTMTGRASSPAARPSRAPRLDADGFAIPDLPIDRTLLEASNIAHSELVANEQAQSLSSMTKQPPAKRSKGRSRKKKKAPLIIPDEDLEIENDLEDEIEKILTDPKMLTDMDNPIFVETEARAQALANQIRGPSTVSEEEIIGEEEFVDDPEVMNCVLSPAEVAIKEKIWVTHNEDWLREQQAKLLKKMMEDANGGPKKKQRRTKQPRMGDGSLLEGTPASSPAEAMHKMLQKRSKGFSRHINYEKLNQIYKNITDQDNGAATSSDGSPQAGGQSGVRSPTSSQSSQDQQNTHTATALVTPTARGTPALVLPTPSATQATQQSRLAVAPISRSPPVTVIPDDDEEEEEEEEEEDVDEEAGMEEMDEDETSNPIRQFLGGDEYEDVDMGFDEDYGADD